MEPLRLLFKENPATGLPQLEDPGNQLTAEERPLVTQEVQRHFERLILASDGQVFTLDGLTVSRLPQRFRITRVPGANKRFPTLILEAVDRVNGPAPARNGAAPKFEPSQFADGAATGSTANRWAPALISDLRRWLDRANAGDGAAPLQRLLNELAAVARDRPDEFGLLLLTGYLYVAESISREQDPQRLAAYMAAGEALEAIGGERLPAGALGGLEAHRQQCAAAHAHKSSWLRSLWSRTRKQHDTLLKPSA